MKIIHYEIQFFLKVAKQLRPPMAVYPQNVDNLPRRPLYDSYFTFRNMIFLARPMPIRYGSGRSSLSASLSFSRIGIP